MRSANKEIHDFRRNFTGLPRRRVFSETALLVQRILGSSRVQKLRPAAGLSTSVNTGTGSGPANRAMGSLIRVIHTLDKDTRY
jgi:hypothetical protein